MPFVLAIGVLVFLGAFVPMIGATVAGTVAVLVALVDQGPVTALIMLGGRDRRPAARGPRAAAVPDGPLGLGAPARRDRRDRRAACSSAGIAGALVAVPLAAAVNAVVQHLAAYTEPGDDPVEELAEDYEETGETSAVEEDPVPPGDSDDPEDGAVGG